MMGYKPQTLRRIKSRIRVGNPVTVCVAAIARETIIGASDRMLTSGDIEFEPDVTKLHKLNESICIMIAGDVSLQAEILHSVISDVQADPKAWKVSEVADLYYESFQRIRRVRAERAILKPLNLSFLDLRDLQYDLAVRLSSDILNYELPPVEAIVTGRDSTGPHIYEVNNEGTCCRDWVAFASIGVGANHANSQIMFAGHNRGREISDTMFLVYSAKKRAEIAPGVGKATDMFFLEPGDTRQYFIVNDTVMAELESCYAEMRGSVDTARNVANGRINGFVQSIIQPSTPVQVTEVDNGQRQITAGDS